MTPFVVDANVAIKWVLSEIYSSDALRLLNDDYELLVPDFFFPEIANILWKRFRRGETTLELAQQDLSTFMGGDLQVCPSLPLLKTLTIPDRDVGQAVLPTSCVPVGRRSLAGSQTFECRNPTDNQKCRLASHQA